MGGHPAGKGLGSRQSRGEALPWGPAETTPRGPAQGGLVLVSGVGRPPSSVDSRRRHEKTPFKCRAQGLADELAQEDVRVRLAHEGTRAWGLRHAHGNTGLPNAKPRRAPGRRLLPCGEVGQGRRRAGCPPAASALGPPGV